MTHSSKMIIPCLLALLLATPLHAQCKAGEMNVEGDLPTTACSREVTIRLEGCDVVVVERIWLPYLKKKAKLLIKQTSDSADVDVGKVLQDGRKQRYTIEGDDNLRIISVSLNEQKERSQVARPVSVIRQADDDQGVLVLIEYRQAQALRKVESDTDEEENFLSWNVTGVVLAIDVERVQQETVLQVGNYTLTVENESENLALEGTPTPSPASAETVEQSAGDVVEGDADNEDDDADNEDDDADNEDDDADNEDDDVDQQNDDNEDDDVDESDDTVRQAAEQTMVQGSWANINDTIEVKILQKGDDVPSCRDVGGGGIGVSAAVIALIVIVIVLAVVGVLLFMRHSRRRADVTIPLAEAPVVA